MLRSVPVNLRLTLGTCIVLAVFSDSLLDFLTLFFSKPFSSEVAEPFVWGKKSFHSMEGFCRNASSLTGNGTKGSASVNVGKEKGCNLGVS